jgi:secreted PhoX family phosphatase
VINRRRFLAGTLGGAAYFALGGPLARAATGPYGALRTADARGIRLPRGFTSRIVARSGSKVGPSSYVWHRYPDGGACFPAGTDGWVYVSNSEVMGSGGAGAIRFTSTGAVKKGYRILSGTSRNCAGGPTPWGTWLSCEEFSSGRVWECDPLGWPADAVVRPALGRFEHEAAAVDPVGHAVYLTEDNADGRLYRFRPDAWPSLSAGVLEAATVTDGIVTWSTVPDPSASTIPTRQQVPDSTPFSHGEGAWYADGTVWFTTKGDNRVWALDVASDPQQLRIVYDLATAPDPVLSGVDNVVSSQSGDLFVAEDGGNLELILIEPGGAASVFLRVVGQAGSELTGPAFSPNGKRLYFSSQRGPTGSGTGVTYEVKGPFRTTA